MIYSHYTIPGTLLTITSLFLTKYNVALSPCSRTGDHLSNTLLAHKVARKEAHSHLGTSSVVFGQSKRPQGSSRVACNSRSAKITKPCNLNGTEINKNQVCAQLKCSRIIR